MDASVHVGVCAGDPLRTVGLCTILDECAGVRARSVDVADDAKLKGLTALLLDASCVPDLLPVLARLRRERPDLRVVVLGESDDPTHIQSVIAAGAKGYLPETATEEEFRMAMGVVLDGSVWAPRKVLARLIEAGGIRGAAGDGSVWAQLTTRECDVLKLLLEGRSNRQIADAMQVEPVTVKAHMGRMLRKAGVKNRVELTLKAAGEKR